MNNYDKLYLYSQNLSLLIVEDYEPHCKNLYDTLINFFETVETASDGIQGLDAYNSHHKTHGKGFDIILSDIQMPRMNGVEFSQAIRKIDPHQKLIILSAHTDTDYFLPLINLNINAFIPKPIDEILLFDILIKESRLLSVYDQTLNQKDKIRLSDGYFWDITQQELSQDGISIPLSKYALILLEFLIQKREFVCSNLDILQIFDLHGIDIDEKNIRHQIYTLRQKLPKGMIDSIYGIGYKLSILN